MTENDLKLVMAISDRVNSLAENVLVIYDKVSALEKRVGIYTDTYKGVAVTAEHEPTFDNVHHCGQDAGERKVSCGNLEATVSCKNLLGMQVVSVGGSKTRCVGRPQETDSCFKVELVGGDYLCLSKPQEDERPVISFDDDNGNVMDDIKEKVDDFMNYLDSIVKTEE